MKPIINILYIGSTPEYFETLPQRETAVITSFKNNLMAVNYLNSHKKIDAVICDYNLPGQNGLFLFNWIRERFELNHIPFILIANEFNSEVFKTAFTSRVDDYFIAANNFPNHLIERIHFLSNFRKKAGKSLSVKRVLETYKMPVTKRIFDIAVASTVLLAASPFLLLIIIAIRLESKGKIYYTAKRVGRKTFDFYKLRSMRTGSDDLLKKLAKEKNQYNNTAKQSDDTIDGPCPLCAKLNAGETCSPVMYVDTHQICDYWYNHQKKEAAKRNSTFVKIVDDPRVTRVGKFIRNTSIDELPQLINVIKGDMSIVGNRPLPVYEAELLTEDALSKRFLAPAGITGLWQVELRGKGGNMSEDERKRLDNEYADHFKGNSFSFWYDIKLILRTVPALLQKSAV
jgi:lipopolysaccharide/colanic/teichoic acid biosynthesis glycosyltransferase